MLVQMSRPRYLSTLSFGLTVALLWIVGCDPKATPTTLPTTTPSVALAVGKDEKAAVVKDVSQEKRHRISLIVIPFTIEAPVSWVVQLGAANRFVLHGKTPSGEEIEILLGTLSPMKADIVSLFLKQMSGPQSDPLVKSSVVERDGMKIVQQIEPLSNQPADPETVPIRWTIQYLYAERAVDYSVYELSVSGLTLSMMDRDTAFIQSILNTIQHDTAATQPANLR